MGPDPVDPVLIYFTTVVLTVLAILNEYVLEAAIGMEVSNV